MTCQTFQGGVICGPPRGVIRRRVLHCWNCETKRRVVQIFQGAWYGDHFYCCHCGDGWGDRERMERPFQRGWRQRSIARAKRDWDRAITAEQFREHVHAALEAA